jgi:hypothetical protein
VLDVEGVGETARVCFCCSAGTTSTGRSIGGEKARGEVVIFGGAARGERVE